MAFVPHNRPRGLNFLLGGSVAAAAILSIVLLTGGFDINLGGAPSVRIDDAEMGVY